MSHSAQVEQVAALEHLAAGAVRRAAELPADEADRAAGAQAPAVALGRAAAAIRAEIPAADV